MNRPFWLFCSASSENLCSGIKPLLSAYADGMASPAETRRVETHLPACEGCRIALSWIQATRTTLASRPVAVPPPDLHLRIALAIAASSPAPVTLRPARVFSLRTIYAAAASVTALGAVLSYSLWHAPAEVAAKHPAKPAVLTAAVKPQLRVKPQFTPKAPIRSLVASNTAKSAVKPSVLARKKAPLAAAPLEHVAANSVPAERSVVLPSVTPKTPVHHAPVTQKIASRNIVPAETHGTEKRLPLPAANTVTPKLPDALKVAKVIKEPSKLRLDLPPIKVTPDLPSVRVASTHEAALSKPDYGMGELRAHLRVQNATFVPIHIAKQEISRGAASMMQTVGTIGNSDQTAIIGDIHGNQ